MNRHRLKSKRWYRRNRHTNSNLVSAYRMCQFCFEYYNEYHFPVAIKRLSDYKVIDEEIYENGFRCMSFEDFEWIDQDKPTKAVPIDEYKPSSFNGFLLSSSENSMIEIPPFKLK